MKIIYSLLTVSLIFFSCAQTEPMVSKSSLIEAESFSESSGTVQVTDLPDAGKAVTGLEKGGWLQFEVEVKTPGRYKCEVDVLAGDNSDGYVWVEDYVDNEDGRSYNITAAMPLNGAGKQTLAKEGSPLNTGIHKMRLHVEGDQISLDKFRFKLMREHRLTPKTLTQKTDGKVWKQVWSDEFDGSGLPDTSKWTFDFGNWGWGNNEPQYYTAFRTENARQENGNLIIEARKDDMGQPWTSARLTTRGKISFLYGKIELRAKVPVADGTWPAAWLLGDAYRDELSWPYCGEVDILECVGREIDDETGDGINHASWHTRAYYFKQGNQITSTLPVKNMSGEYHTYGIEWKPDGITAYVDNQVYYTYDKLNGEWEWPFNNPQNIILNLAMGGGMGQAIDPAITSQQFVIDYVRVFELQ